MSRIQGNDTIQDVFVKLSEGNPGALSTMAEIYKQGPEIDPDAILGGLTPIAGLDTLGIYGTDIYVLFSDICENSIPKMLAVLRAVQLGFFPAETVKDAASRQDRSGAAMIPVDELYRQIQERLPRFNTNL